MCRPLREQARSHNCPVECSGSSPIINPLREPACWRWRTEKCSIISASSSRLHHLAPLLTTTPESAGLCGLGGIGNLVRVTEWSVIGFSRSVVSQFVKQPKSQAVRTPELNGSCAQGAFGRAGNCETSGRLTCAQLPLFV